MTSILPNFEYDIFISYRHNDNRSGWVTEFVNALQEELASTIKEPISLYFDFNPRDGLLETHSVDKSLEGKLKSLIFIPIISQTYCDPNSFAWQHEFCAFNEMTKRDYFGRDIKLSDGNVASRILPIKIHEIDSNDKSQLETELGAVLRTVDFIYKEAGVNRPLRLIEENPGKNQNQTIYRNQVNKIANAIKELIYSLKNHDSISKLTVNEVSPRLQIEGQYHESPINFWQELKRRSIIKVATVYAITGWVLMQVATTVFPPLNIPAWALTFLIIIILLGFPIALILAWAFEMSPSGIVRTKPFSVKSSLNDAKRNSLIRNLSLGSLIAIGIALTIYFKFYYHTIKGNRSIAVLPFVNMSNDPAQDYFSDGITDEILDALTHIKGLKVSSRTSAFEFKGKNPNLKEAGKKLGVNTILEGSVQKDGDRFRITVQLINVEDDFHIWSEKFDIKYSKSEDIFAIQDKIASGIAERLSLSLATQDGIVIHRIPTVSKEAHEWYLKGRFFWNQRSPVALKKGIEFFEKAIEEDPLYASAYAGLADCYTWLGYLSVVAPNDVIPKAKIAAAKALEIDSTLAEAHTSVGFFKFYYDWDWEGAEREFKLAIELNPNYEVAYDWYGYYLTAMERYEEAAAILKKANDLDPLSVPISTDMGFSLYYSGNYDKALSQLQSSLEMSPRFAPTHNWIGRAYQQKKMYKESIDEYQKALLAQPGWTVALAAIGNVYAITGKHIQAQKILDTLDIISKKRFVTSYGVALVHAGLGEKDKTFEWLNKAYEERSNWLVWIKSDPRWVSIRSDKRFSELIHRVGLPDLK